MKPFCQDIITGLRGELLEELNKVHEGPSELRKNTTKALDHVGARLANVENSMPSVVIAKEVSRPRKDLNSLMEGQNALSNEMELRFSRDAERLTAVKKISVLDRRPALATRVSRERHEQVKKTKGLSDTDSDRSANFHSFSDSEEENRFS